MDYYYCSSDPLSSLTTSSAASSSSCALLSYSSSSIILPPSPSTTQKSSTKYKGVVPQPNGRWGAQLYNGRKRVWIGTFDSREHAAHAYDIAILRFRGPHNFTNFPIRHYGGPHTEFLPSLSESRVIDMLRNHTYQDELARFKRARIRPDPGSSSAGRELLFKKVMTPSDVGRLHRLVIPKHHAESYFPKIDKNHNNNNNNNKNNDQHNTSSSSSSSSVGKMLSFEDGKRDKMWKFKYCYWKSSQNYVLTKGWGEFVRDKGLKPGDTVYFCSNNNTTTTSSCDNKQFYIDTSSSTLPDHHDNDNTNTNDEVAALSRFKALRLFGVDITSTY